MMSLIKGDSAGTDDSQKVMDNTHANEAVGKDDAQVRNWPSYLYNSLGVVTLIARLTVSE